MPALEAISIRGFKSISEMKDVQLGPINVLIGPNGSGKSNFIEVFSFLHAIREGSLQTYVTKSGGADKLLHFGAKTTSDINITIKFAEHQNGYRVKLISARGDQLLPAGEEVWYWRKTFAKPYTLVLSADGSEAGISRSKQGKVAEYVRAHLDGWRKYHFHDTGPGSPMKVTADVNDNRFLRSDGSNIASFLFFLKEKHPSAYSLIRRAVQRMAPFFDDFILEPRRLNPDKIILEWRHKGSDSYFDAGAFSDGTLRFIALATLFLQPAEFRPSVVLVDEPELGLHPYAIGLLASLIKASSSVTQVIVSTQSPHLLDHFQPEDVLVANRSSGGTQLSRLEPSKLAIWLQDYSLGQLWEKNEIGGRPSAE